LELDPHNSLAARLLAENFNRAGELSEAVAAVTNSPSDFGLRLKLGNQLVALGRFDEARAQFAEAVRLKPDSTDARDLLGFELARVGQFAEALPHFAERVKLEPNNAEAHMNLGVAFVRVHRLEEAAKEFELALQINPVDDRVKKYLEKVRVLRGQ
jgi:superkiller protein 3